MSVKWEFNKERLNFGKNKDFFRINGFKNKKMFNIDKKKMKRK